MKALIPVLFLFSAAGVLANTPETAFRKDSAVPDELKILILEELRSRCPDGISYGGLAELQTAVRQDRVDQGVIDSYYVTSFASRYAVDGVSPKQAIIVVHSAAYAHSPLILEVSRIISEACKLISR
ncbi:MAG: hypothetical protein NDJ89_04510 [Oligoflexia bacterium]|nr:hypothetical protein [Oligoflexia bacterium]